jgi:hypothetical protein
MATEQARFSLKVDADAESAAEAAEELEAFRKAIEKGQDALGSYRKSLALLKGNSDAVKTAKQELIAKIDVEKSAITKANLGILKLGSSYDKLAKAAKKNTSETGSGKKAIAAIGGPLKGLSEKLSGLKETMPILSSGWGLLAAGVAAGVAALAMAGAAVGDLTAKFTTWLATAADANRNLQLQREAFTGSTASATAWGHVMDWASEKTALTTAQMQALVVATEKNYRGFRLSGQGMVDAFKASAAAAGAGREDVASFFDELISRGKQTGRSFISFQDFAKFRNAGIDVNSVMKELGVTSSQAMRGAIVSTDRMAAALKRVSENRFAEINAKKTLSLGFQWDHLKDNFMRFTNDLAGSGGALEPLLKAIAEVAKMFDLSTDSGQELKKTITSYGTALSNAIVSHLPDIKAFVSGVIKLGGAFIDGAAAVVKWSQSSTGLTIIKGLLIGIGVAAGIIAVSFIPIAIVAAAIVAGFALIGLAIYGIYAAVKKIVGLDWAGIGSAIVDGIKSGLTAAWSGLKNAVTGMGEGIKTTFKSILGIASPSKEFAKYGVQSGQGYESGIRGAKPDVQAATQSLASSASEGISGPTSTAVVRPPEPASTRGGGSESAQPPANITVKNTFHIGGKDGDEIKQQLQSGSVLDGIAQSIRLALQASGLPVAATSTSGGP